jgi:transcriptional activator SPT8
MNDGDDMDVDADQDAEADGDGDGDDDDNEDDNADEDEDDEPLSQVRRPSLPTTNTTSSDGDNTGNRVNGTGPTSHPQGPSIVRTSASPDHTSSSAHSPRVRYEVRPEALNAALYDIVPTIAAPQSTSINCVTATPDMRYWFTGGSDCFIPSMARHSLPLHKDILLWTV